MINHDELQKRMIFNALDIIEAKTGDLAHENEYISLKLHLWQDGKLKNSQFLETLNKYMDELNKLGDFLNSDECKKFVLELKNKRKGK